MIICDRDSNAYLVPTHVTWCRFPCLGVLSVLPWWSAAFSTVWEYIRYIRHVFGGRAYLYPVRLCRVVRIVCTVCLVLLSVYACAVKWCREKDAVMTCFVLPVLLSWCVSFFSAAVRFSGLNDVQYTWRHFFPGRVWLHAWYQVPCLAFCVLFVRATVCCVRQCVLFAFSFLKTDIDRSVLEKINGLS